MRVKNRCANCGNKLKAEDKDLRNVDGEPCCNACWEEEELKLNRQ